MFEIVVFKLVLNSCKFGEFPDKQQEYKTKVEAKLSY